MGKTREEKEAFLGVGKLDEEEFTHVTESKSIVKQCFYSRSDFSLCACQVCKKNDSFMTFKPPLHQENHGAVLAAGRFKFIKIHA